MATTKFMQAEKADATMGAALEYLLEDHHSDLKDAGVRVCLMAAYGKRDQEGDLTGYAITKKKRRVLGECQILNAKDRASYDYDVRVTLDGDYWKERVTQERCALLDHELMHVEIVVDDRGVVTDDEGHASLKIREHDYELHGFTSVARRWKGMSTEVQQLKAVVDDTGQLRWGFDAESIPSEPAANDVHVTH